MLQRAAEERRSELGVYVTSKGFSKQSPPEFICNVHAALGAELAGKRIQESPSAFVLVGVRDDLHQRKAIESFVTERRPSVLRGGHWISRPYEAYGASLEWAYRNYPASKRECSLRDWHPSFDVEYA
jgi:hypothetical protein